MTHNTQEHLQNAKIEGKMKTDNSNFESPLILYSVKKGPVVFAHLLCVYLWNLCCLVLLQLLLKAKVWANKRANGLDRRQTLLPAVVGDGHQVGHHHGSAAGDTGKATRTQGTWCQFGSQLFIALYFYWGQ